MAKCTGIRCPMQHPYKVDECNNTDCQYRTEPITNADRIRAMSDEELAEFLADDNRVCPPKHPYCSKYVSSCNGCFLEWLKQPAEE